MSRCLGLLLCIVFLSAEPGADLWAQSGKTLTLKEAEAIAVKAHPRLSAAQFAASAAKQVPTQIRSARLPTLYGSFTGALADENTRIAAGGLNNPLILSRVATGITVGQMITDFGRTHQLTEAYESELKRRSSHRSPPVPESCCKSTVRISLR